MLRKPCVLAAIVLATPASVHARVTKIVIERAIRMLAPATSRR